MNGKAPSGNDGAINCKVIVKFISRPWISSKSTAILGVKVITTLLQANETRPSYSLLRGPVIAPEIVPGPSTSNHVTFSLPSSLYPDLYRPPRYSPSSLVSALSNIIRIPCSRFSIDTRSRKIPRHACGISPRRFFRIKIFDGLRRSIVDVRVRGS